MKKRFLTSIILITVVVTGIFIWFSSHPNHNNDSTIPFVLSVLFVLAFSMLSPFKIMKIVLATTIGLAIAMAIKIAIDMRTDPTSHNLFPFEIIIDVIFIFIASLIGAAIGLIYRKLIKRKAQV